VCREVEERAAQTLQWAEDNNLSLLDIALDPLTLGRASLYRTILEKSEIGNLKSEIELAVDDLRRAGAVQFLVSALLTRAWLRSLTGPLTGPESAQSDLDEAWEIAERGSMRLFMADVLLYLGRLFRDKTALAEARRLIEDCGYHRRDGELADAEEVAKGW